MLQPSTSVQYVRGIGPKLAEVLAAKGIQTLDDLLHYLPFRYEDRLNPRGISELRAGEMATVIAEVRTSGFFRTRRMPIFEMTAGQGRSRLKCIWFNAAYLRDKFKPGQMVALYGKVEENRGELQLVQPQFEIIDDASGDGSAEATEKKVSESLEIGRIVPIYETAGQGSLTPRWFRRTIRWCWPESWVCWPLRECLPVGFQPAAPPPYIRWKRCARSSPVTTQLFALQNFMICRS